MKYLKHTKKKKPHSQITDDLDIVLPGKEELKALYEISLNGDMDEIIACLDKLLKKNSQVTSFVIRLEAWHRDVKMLK